MKILQQSVIYLDIMSDGRFLCQLTYNYCPLWPIDEKEVEAFVYKKRPSLTGKKIEIAFSHNRVIN